VTASPVTSTSWPHACPTPRRPHGWSSRPAYRCWKRTAPTTPRNGRSGWCTRSTPATPSVTSSNTATSMPTTGTDTRMSTSKKSVVADRLREAIDRGDYRPGQRLPGEEELAELFHVSRATARLGVRILQKEGRVDIHAGRGVYVANHRPIVHLAGPVSGGTDAERCRTGYESHLREAGYHQVEDEVKVRLDTMRSRVAKRLRGDAEEGESQGGLVVIRLCNRFVESGLWQSQVTHFPYEIAGNPPLMAPERLDRSIISVLGERGHHDECKWDVVGARMPSREEADSFDLGPGIPLLVQERVTYTGLRPLRFTETIMPANRHQLLYSNGDAPEDLLLLA